MRASSSSKRNSASVLASSVFPTPVGPRKMNEPLGRLGSFRPARVRRMARRERRQRLLLTDDPLVQLVFHPEQLRGLLLGEAVHRNTGPVGQDLGDDLLVDHVEEVDALAPPLRLHGLLAVEPLLLLIRQLLRLLEGAPLDGGLLVGADAGDLLVEGLVVRRRGHAADAQPAARLVDEVDRLVGEVTVGQIAVGQVGRRHQRLVGDRDRVVRLVAVPQPLQDVDGQSDRGLIDLDRLEPALERGVLFQVLAVLVERGRADRLQLAPASIGFRIEAASIAPSAAPAPTSVWISSMNKMMSPRVRISFKTFFEALLEVTPVAAARRPTHRGRGCRAACR